MKALIIDSSSPNLSFSIFSAGKIIADFNHCYNFGASKLISFLDESFKRNHITAEDFDILAIGYGPGSFTGLRISFSVVKAFSLALKKPVITIESFYLMAYPFRKKYKKIAVISDAKMGLIYGCSFKVKDENLVKEQKERLVNLEEFIKGKSDYFFITYDMDLYKKVSDSNPGINSYGKAVYPNAKNALSVIEIMYKKGKFVNMDKLEPLYLHPKTCQIRRSGKNN